MGTYCFMVTEFAFGMMKKSWKGTAVMDVDCECASMCLNCTTKKVKMVFLMLHIFHHKYKSLLTYLNPGQHWRVHSSLPLTLFVTSFSDNKKPGSPYLKSIYLLLN